MSPRGVASRGIAAAERIHANDVRGGPKYLGDSSNKKSANAITVLGIPASLLLWEGDSWRFGLFSARRFSPRSIGPLSVSRAAWRG